MNEANHIFKTVKPRFRKKIVTKNNFKKSFRLLERKFPKAFNLKRPKPLAIGIRDEIFLSGIDMSKKSIRKALTFYCGCHQYLQCIKEDVSRINLSGKPSDSKVTKTEAERAYEQCSALFSRISKNHGGGNNSPSNPSKVVVKKKRSFTKPQ